MGKSSRRVRTLLVVVATVLVIGPRRAGSADANEMEQLRRDLDGLKHRLAEIEALTRQQQEMIRKQDAVIRKLSGQQPPPVAAPTTTAAPAAPTPETKTADEERLQRQVTENIMRRIQPSLLAANKTFPAQFNPAIGLIIDNVFSYSNHDRGNFEFRAAELGLSANVDPFVRGYAIITGAPDGFEVEEAAIVTTSLPYNLTLKGGRFFADFGRLSKFHDHDLPFVNRPIVLDRFVGGESQADGVELSYLVPIPQYLTLTGGAYNKLGAENDRADNAVARDFSKFTYLGRAATFINLTDEHSLDLGTSYAYTPEVASEDSGARHLAGVDLTFRYLPLSQASYRGLIWGTELLYDQEDRPLGGFPAADAALVSPLARGLGFARDLMQPGVAPVAAVAAPLTFRRRDATGAYSYVEARLSRRYYPGFLFDWSQDIDHVTGDTKAYSPYLTVWMSEFQRLRFQYTRLEAPNDHDNQFFLQWTVVLGSHVHGFRDR